MKSNKRVTIALAVALASLMFVVCASCAEAADAAPLVYSVPIKGPIEHGVAAFLARGLREAREAGAEAVIIEIDTPGGFVDAALKMRDSIMTAGVPTVAFVNTRAWSAGALIAIACGDVGMKMGGSMGAAETRPKEEKYISAMRAEFEATAEMRGRDPKIAGAMVDADVEIPGLIERGKILTLTAKQAKDVGYSDYNVRDIGDLLEQAGLAGAELHEVDMTSSEWLGRALTNEVAAQVLLTLGLVGLAVEVFTPGFGIPGAIGLVSLALFFGGRIVGGLAGWEVVVLFLVGLSLLLLELFVIPGFGVAGILGIVSIFGSLILSYPTPAQAMGAISISIVVAVFLIFLLIRFLSRGGKKLGRAGRIVLEHSEAPEEGYVGVEDLRSLLDEEARATTPL
ncbi:MAG TPA: peptidase S14, partial [Firmicutes bacterium]|nr:peptidase S14 [Bacillota bacterium]